MNKKETSSYYSLFDHAPMPAAILHAETLQLEMANPPMLKLWGRSKTVIGTPLLEFIPEIAEMPYADKLREVCQTGNPYEEKGSSVWLNRWGKEEHIFMDYSYTPIFGGTSKANAILVLATDICEQELNRLIAQQSLRDLRSVVMNAPIAMCIYRGADFRIEAVNDHMLNLWQNTQEMNLPVLNHVFHNGISYSYSKGNIHYSCTPLNYGIGDKAGVCVVAARK